MAFCCLRSASLSHGAWSFLGMLHSLPLLLALWLHAFSALLYLSILLVLGQLHPLAVVRISLPLIPISLPRSPEEKGEAGKAGGQGTRALCVVTLGLCQEPVLRLGEHTQFLRGGRTFTLLTKFSLLPWSLHFSQNHPVIRFPHFTPFLHNSCFYDFSVTVGTLKTNKQKTPTAITATNNLHLN